MIPTEQDTELFELCKKVYGATGWDVEYKYFYGTSSVAHDRQHSMLENTPLYTSDYLLEKLPEEIDGYPITLQAINGWQASLCYDGAEDVFAHKAESDTPLKALLKLTLKLHEAEIL